MKEKINILKISDGKTGHTHAANNIINSLAEVYPRKEVSVDTLEIRIKYKFYLKIFKYLFNNERIFQYFLSKDNFIEKIYNIQNTPSLELKDYDYIVSGGGVTSLVNIYYGKKFNIKNIYASRLRGLDNKLFYLIVTIYKEEDFENSIVLDFSPMDKKSLDKEKLESFKEKIQYEKEKTYFGLMIGGNGAGYKYTSLDFKILIENFLKLLKENNAYGIVTTSRRTLIENDELINTTIQNSDDRDRVKYLILFNQKEEYFLDCYIDISNTIFVTEDSGSMLSESILSNKNVYSLQPENISKNKLYNKYMENLEKYIVKRLKIEDIDRLKVDQVKKNNIPSPSAIFETKLKEFLQR